MPTSVLEDKLLFQAIGIEAPEAIFLSIWTTLWWVSMWWRNRRKTETICAGELRAVRNLLTLVASEKSWGLGDTMPLKEFFCLFSATKDHDEVQACTAAGSYVWVYCSAAAGLYVDISDSCYHRGPCRGLLSEPTPEAMLVFDSHVGIGTRWSRWQVLLPGSMMTFILELKVRAKSESIALLQPGSVLISVTILTIEGQVDVPPGDTLAVCQTVSEAMPVWVICKVS